MEVIIAEKLEKNFGDVRALRGLDLAVPEGVFGFVGVNGAGKTTTIKILLGALRPDSGAASVFGYDCAKESLKIRQKVGVLHEKPSFPKSTTGLDYLVFVAQLYGLPLIEAKNQSKRTLEEVGLFNVAKRPIGSFSAGMMQRLGLAQALVGNPDLIILDEPTANLDPIGRSDLLEMIRKLHADKNVDFLISSHILPELQTVCDHVGIINNGVMLVQGKAQEVVRKHAGHIFKVSVSEPETFLDLIQRSELVEETRRIGDIIWVKAKDATSFQNYVIEMAHRKKLGLSLFQRGDLESALKNLLEANKDD